MEKFKIPKTQKEIDELGDLELADKFERENTVILDNGVTAINTQEIKESALKTEYEYIDKQRKFFQEKRWEASPIIVDVLNILEKEGFNFKDKRALDLGAGSLIDSEYLSKQGFDVVAVDRIKSEKWMKHIKDLSVEFVHKELQNYSFPEESFDLINAKDVLQFIPEDVLQSVITGIKASIKEKGVFVGRVFGSEDSRFQGKKIKGVKTFTKEELEAIFEEFHIIKLEEDFVSSEEMQIWKIIAKKK